MVNYWYVIRARYGENSTEAFLKESPARLQMTIVIKIKTGLVELATYVNCIQFYWSFNDSFFSIAVVRCINEKKYYSLWCTCASWEKSLYWYVVCMDSGQWSKISIAGRVDTWFSLTVTDGTDVRPSGIDSNKWWQRQQ